MTFYELCNAIESHRMAAEINVASSRKVAIDIVRNHPVISELAEKLIRPGAPDQIFLRILELTSQATDPRYENPNDTALMVYVTLLNWRDRKLALIASSAICQMPNLWWAHRVATELLERSNEQNEMTGETSTPVAANADSGDRVFITDVRSFLHLYPLRLLRHLGVNSSPANSETRTVVWPGELRMRTNNDSVLELEPEAVAA